jgi:hypothetical protein
MKRLDVRITLAMLPLLTVLVLILTLARCGG